MGWFQDFDNMMRNFEAWLFEQHFSVQWVAFAFAMVLALWPAYKMIKKDLEKLKRT